MNKQTFWKIMSETRQASGGSPAIQLELIEQKLNKLSPEEIVEYDAIFQELVDDAYDWKLWGAAYLINGGCADDCFMDFRGWLVGQGEAIYTNALADPDGLAELDDMEEGMEWEGYGYLAFTAYEAKTGREMPRNENRIRLENPKGEPWSEEELVRLLPKLSEKFAGY